MRYVEESFARSKSFSGAGYDFTIHFFAESPALEIREGDEVVVEVSTSTGENVLTGGNPLEIQVLQGFARLAMRDMISGETVELFAEPGMDIEISPHNTFYQFTNLSNEPFIYRDYCEDFNPSDEPSLNEYLTSQPQV